MDVCILSGGERTADGEDAVEAAEFLDDGTHRGTDIGILMPDGDADIADDLRTVNLTKRHTVSLDAESSSHVDHRHLRVRLSAAVVDLPGHDAEGPDVGFLGEEGRRQDFGGQPSDGDAGMGVHLVAGALAGQSEVGNFDLAATVETVAGGNVPVNYLKWPGSDPKISWLTLLRWMNSSPRAACITISWSFSSGGWFFRMYESRAPSEHSSINTISGSCSVATP